MSRGQAKPAPIVPASASRGRRSPELLATPPGESPVAVTGLPVGQTMEIFYVVGRRPLRHQGKVLQPGEEVPGAAEWPRIEAWVSARSVVRCSRVVELVAEEPVTEDDTAEEPASATA